MRGTFVKTLLGLMEQDERIILLTADLGYTVLEPFRDNFPKRFFNVGVAEQNMMGLATGLAEAGFIPFVYSIATFATLRPYEFIRNGPILHKLPVRIVGIGGGFDYGSAGPTHYGLEDIGLMRMQPGMTVVVPADYEQARSAILMTWNLPGPVYYRLSKDEKTIIPGLNQRFELEKAQIVREGTDLAIIAMGSITTEAILAAETLSNQGVSCLVVVVASISPSPTEDLAKSLSRFPMAVTVEAHFIEGGLGSLVSEVIAERGLSCRLVRCGVKALPDGVSGSQAYMYEKHGLSGKKIADIVLEELRVQARN